MAQRKNVITAFNTANIGAEIANGKVGTSTVTKHEITRYIRLKQNRVPCMLGLDYLSKKFEHCKLQGFNCCALWILNVTIIYSQQLVVKIFLFLFFQRRRAILKQENENILIVKTGGLGDFLFGLPALNVIKRERPLAKLTLLTQIALSGEHLKNLENKGLSELPWLRLVEDYFSEIMFVEGISSTEVLTLRKAFKDKKFTSIIYMSAPGEPFLSILKKLLFFLALGGASSSIHGWKQSYSTAFFRKYHASWRVVQHKIKGPLSAVEHFLGHEVQICESDLKLGELSQFTSAPRSLDFEAILDRYDGYIVVCPGSSAAWKNWGSLKYKDLCERLSPLLADRKILVLMAGPKSDRGLADSILQGLKGHNICGDYSIAEFSDIFRRARCVVTTDGGLAHLAAFSNAKLVSISNSNEEAGVVTPVGDNVVELRNFISCAPCFGMDHCPLQHSKCVKDINVMSVYGAIKTIINSY